MVDAAERRLAPAMADATADVAGLRAALVKIEGEVKDLTDAIASGVGLSSVVTALRAREDERGIIQRRIEAVEKGQTLAANAPSLWACVFAVSIAAASAQSVDPVGDAARHNQLNLAGDGRSFLIREASRASFTLIGGLHGDKETPALVQDLFRALQPAGYRYLATEMSPWAASRIPGSHPNLWGCDIEEMHSDLIIRDLDDRQSTMPRCKQ